MRTFFVKRKLDIKIFCAVFHESMGQITISPSCSVFFTNRLLRVIRISIVIKEKTLLITDVTIILAEKQCDQVVLGALV
jgi:hypothetical protein